MAMVGEGVVPGTSYTIGGVKVEFPCKAYPTQLSMMSMIIKGIERHQNCLLESPTGSGKSLALLCSCLAWQQNEYRKRDKESNEAANCGQNDCQESFFCTCDCSKTTPPLSVKPCTVTSPPAENVSSPTQAHPGSSNGACQPLTSNGESCNRAEPSSVKNEVEDEDDDADFQPSKKRYRTPGLPGGACKKSKGVKGVVFEDPSDDGSPEANRNPHTDAHWQMKLNTDSVGGDSTKTPCPCPCHSTKEKDLEGKPKEAYKRRKIPRIYFGTRTHKQITQIVRELGRTAYKNVPMCILGSREYTCVHPDVSRGFNKNDGCKELLEGRNGQSCRYYNGAHKIKNQWQIRDRGLTQAWDIEDLVSLGKKIKACPYFAVRSLKDEADIVFCPYNYLVDPMIRMTMDINMKNQIVILDEAHNIEDSARDAASCIVTTDQLEDTVAELDSHIKNEWRESHCRVMHAVSAALLDWVKSHSTNLTQRDFERALRVWSGTEIVSVLAGLGITKDTLGTFQHHLAAIVEEAEPLKKEQENGVSLSSQAGMTLKGLFVIFEFLFKEEMKYMKDFKVAIVRVIAKSNRFQKTDNRWISKRRSSDQSWTLTLNFWCLNPAVAFTDFGKEVRSIILTSGTLSPMSSFQSELGVAFPIQLEANHVVHMSQVWVGTVAIGTNGGSLNGSYKNAETYSFQDEIGLLLLQVCQVIPYGVLCFLPSYGMMSKLSQRWKNTGLWDELEKVKVVMSEARGVDKVNFDEHLREFYEVIKDCENKGIENQPVTGAVCLAVCRGKVSEGMDFADNNARAVMTVGIPFPSIKDTQVELKRQYNDQYSACRGLLTGSEWYEIQAYRAINQALGRCIRHKRDWGALILVDDRYGRNPKKYITGLSKWVRGKVVHHTHAKNALASLDEFAKARLLSPCPQLQSSTMCASPLPSQAFNASFTQEAPATPSTPAPATPASHAPGTPSSVQSLSHNDTAMTNVLRALTLQAQQSQTPAMPNVATPTPNVATPTPMRFFSSAVPPSNPFTFGGGTPGTEVPNTAGLVRRTPNAVLQIPAAGTTQKLVPGPLYRVGPNNAMLPLSSDTSSSPKPPPTVTPAPLQGRLIKEVDNLGKKVVKPIFPTQGGVAPSQNRTPASNPHIPPLGAVVSSSECAPPVPSAATTPVAGGKTPMKNNPLSSVDPRNLVIPVQSNIDYGLKSKVEDCTGSDVKSETVSAQRKESSLSPEGSIPYEVGHVKTPKGKLVFEERDHRLSGRAGSERGDQEPSEVIDLTEEYQDASLVTSPAAAVQEMEVNRALYDSTPLLFDSDEGGVDESSPCPKITSDEGPYTTVMLSLKRELEEEDEINKNTEGTGLMQPLQRVTSTKSFKSGHANSVTPASASTTNRSRLSPKKKKALNPDPREGKQTNSRGKMLLRRSSRTRKRSGELCPRVGEASADGDFLDDIPCGIGQKNALEKTLCKSGIFCATCGSCFTECLDEVHLISDATRPANLTYLAGQAKLTNSKTRKPYHAAAKFCQCVDGDATDQCPKARRRVNAGLYRVSANSLKNVSSQIEHSLLPQRDFGLNAHWSEKDQCCYQPITCAVCRTKRNATPPLIGYKLVAVGEHHDLGLVPGQAWLFIKDVAHCRRFTPKE